MKHLLHIVSIIFLLTGIVQAQDMAVTSTTPSDGSSWQELDTNITITFDENIAPASANYNSITVVGSSSGNLSFGTNYSVSGNTVTLNPGADFDYSETITVTVTEQVQDLTEPIPQDLASPYVFTFTTKGPAPVPSVVSTVPAANAFNVDADQIISITFDTTMAGTGFDEGVIEIYGSIGGNYDFDDAEQGEDIGNPDITGSGATVSIDLDNSFVAGEIVTVILTTGVSTYNAERGEYGYLESPYVWQFQAGSTENNTLVKADSSYTAGNSPMGIAFADMDNDGDVDIVTANSADNNFSIFLNDGSGLFGSPTNYSTGSTQPENIVIADFNRDGYEDVAVSSEGSNDVKVFTSNNGSGFNGAETYTVGFAPRAITAADFTGDGKIDLATSMTSSDSVAVLINAYSSTNNGFFGPYKFEVGQGPIGITSFDVNNDNIMDIVATSHGTDSVNVLVGSGNGTNFAAYTRFLVGDGPFSVEAGDVDGDGYADLVTANEYASTVSVLINNGSSGFDAKVDYSVGSNPKNAKLVDVDGDGDLDILTVDNGGTTTVTYLENAGDGTFSLAYTYDATGGAYGFNVGDLNGDNIIDFAVGSEGNNFLQVVELYDGAMVTSTTPAANASNISVGSSIVVEFDGALGTSSLTGSTFIVQGSVSGLHDGSFSFSNSDQTVTFDPTDDFEPGEVVTVTTTTGIENPAGSNIPEAGTFQFTVASSGIGDFANLTNYTVSFTNTDDILTGATADLDGDGNPDIVAVDVNNANLTVFFNDGDGTFDDSSVSPQTATSPQDVAAADIDNDGDIDLVSANNSSAGFSIIKNNGDATFANKTDISYSASSSIALGDIDNDGDVDALLNKEGSDTLLVFLNNGSGSFASTPIKSAIADSFTDILLLDSNKDGLLDVLSSHGGSVNSLVISTNNGDGTFTTVDTQSVSGTPAAVAYGFVNSALTLGAANASGDGFFRSEFLASGEEFSGGFTWSGGGNPQGVVMLDFDDNNPFSVNHDDALLANYDDSNLSLQTYSTNTSGFSESTFALDANPWDLASADFNGDGRMDVVTFNNNGKISVLYNMDSTPPTVSSVYPVTNQVEVSGTSNISIQFSMAMNSSSLNSSSVIVSGSLEGQYDGSYSYNSGTNTLTIDPTDAFLPGELISVTVTTDVENSNGINLAASRFTQFAVAGVSELISVNGFTYGSGSSPYAVKFADVDGDSDLDLIMPNTDVDSVSILFNDGSGVYSGLTQYQTGDLPYSVATGDFDGTNGMDFVVTNFNDGDISVFLNNGSGSFSRTDYASGTGSVDVVTGDFNKDGYTDIVVHNRNSASANVHLNDGDGTFTSAGTVSMGTNKDRIFTADIDGDNDLDIAVGGSGVELTIALNNGDGTFAASSGTGMLSWGAVFVDIDDDGDADMIVADDDNNKVSVRLNNGSGTFGSATEYTVASPRDLVVADHGNDGDLDILVISYDASTVEILSNDSGTFSAAGSFNVGTTPRKLAYADIDGDGDLDYATSNIGSDNVSINFGANEPATTTSAASSVLATTATLNGSVDANNNLLDVKFAYKESTEGTYTDTLDATPAQLSSNDAVAVSADLTGLAGNTSYDFKLFATDGDSIWSGSELQFTTALSTPDVITESASKIGMTTVQLNGQISSQNSSTTGYFEYGTSSGVYSDTVHVVENPVDNGLDTDPVTAALTGLSTNTTYYFRMAGSSSGGDAFGDEESFTTLEASVPDVTTNFGDKESYAESVTIFADVVSLNELTEARFVYKQNGAPTYADTVDAVPFQFSADTTTTISATITGLTPNTAYLYRPVISNQFGDSVGTEASVVTTSAPAIVTTDAASSIADTSATLNATVDTRNTLATVRFLYGTTSGVYTDSISVASPSFTGDGITTTASVSLTGLSVETTYYVLAKATGSGGTGVAESEINFTTLGPVPTVSSVSPTVNAVDVSNSSDVAVTFTENMLADSANARTFIVSGNIHGVYAGSYSTSGMVSTFNPTSEFLAGEVITVTLTTGNKSAAGQLMTDTYSTTFVVAADDGYGTFAAASFESYATGSSASEVNVGDLNNDGYPDIVSTYNGNVAVSLNDGDGTFASAVSYGISNVNDVYAADLDNDDDLDLIVSTNSGVSLLFNNGSGSFGSATSYAGGAANSASAFDIDADGDMDVVTGGSNAGPRVYLNNGSGTLSGPTTYESGSNHTYGIMYGDVNNDGSLDVIASRGFSGGVVVYQNNGDGTLGSGTNYTTGSQSQGLRVGDMDGDGYIDIVVANYSSDNTSVLLNDGDGTFASAVNYAIGDGQWDVDLSDMDGDGDLDITTAYQVIDSVSISYNNGSGTFSDHEFYLIGDNPRGITNADFDLDGSMDIVTANNNSSNITVLRREAAAPEVASVSPAAHAVNVADSANITVNFVGAVNQDSLNANNVKVYGSLTGLYSGVFTTTSISFTFNPTDTFKPGEDVIVSVGKDIANSAGTAMDTAYTFQFSVGSRLSEGLLLSAGTMGNVNNVMRILSSDFDSDGDLDVIAFYQSGGFYYYANDGSGSYASGVSYSLGGGTDVSDAALMDIDLDGDLDVVSTDYTTGRLNRILNDGDGTFSSTGSYTASKAASVAVGDFNNDGYAEAVVANKDDNTITVFVNSQSNSFFNAGFGGSTAYSAGTAPVDVAVADVDGDGDMDVIAGNSGSNNVSVFINDGTGALATAVNYTVGTTPTEVSVADVDEDGYADLLVSNSGTDNVSVLINDGDGTFASAVNYTAGDAPAAVTPSDIDGDGDLDMLVANADSDNLSILSNNGDGTFAAAVNYDAGDKPSDIAAFDYDDDGDLDIMTSNYTSGYMTILKRTGGPSILEVLPVANQHFVPADTNLYVKFSKPMNSDSLTSSTIRVVGSLSGLIAGTVTYNAADSSVTIDPSSDFEEGEKVRVTVTTDVEDANNEALEYSYTWEFTVESTTSTIAFQKTEYSDADNVTGMATADIDGDGDNDIVITDTDNDYAIVYLNNGGGTFSSGTDYSVGSQPVSVSLADVDNDGDIDIMTGNRSSSNVSVLLNNGSGTFASAVNYTASSSIYEIKNADINGDGYVDILLAKGQLNALLNNGDGTFGSIISYYSYPNGSTIGYDVDLADFDNDGDLDAVLVANNNTPSLQIVYNLGNGNFASNTNHTLSSSISDVVTADFDQDGYADIAATDYGSNVVRILTNNGDGTVTSSASISVNSNPQALTVGDYDGDGDMDIAVYNSSQQYISIILNDGSGNFGSATTYQTNQLNSYYQTLISADFDGDGQTDIAVPYGSGFNVMIPSPPPAAPSAATSLSFSTITDTLVAMSAQKGSATGLLFLMKEGSAVDFVPSNDVSYSANTTFGAGTELGTGNYSVLNFTGFQSGGAVYDLTRAEDYYVAVYAFNSADGRITYSTTALTGNFTTLLTPTQAGNISITGNFGTRLQLYTNGGNGTARILAMREGSAVTWTPDDSTTYTADTDFSSGVDLGDGTKIVVNGSSNAPAEISGLNVNTTYYFAQFEYFGDAGTENYYATPATANETTSGVAGFTFDSTAGNAISFAGYDGEEDPSTELNDEFEFSDSFTVELWVKADSIGTATNFLYHAGSADSLVVLGLNAAGNFTGIVRDANTSSNVKVTSSTVAAEGQWYHVAISADNADKVRLYVNAVAEDSAAIVDVALGGELDYTEIGGVDGEGNFFYGDMDELRFWGDQRTATELRSNRRTTLSGFPEDLIGYWQFNEEYGDDAEDPYISFNSFGSPELVASSAPLGGTLTTIADFQSGTANLGNVQLTLTEAFDNPVDIEVLEVSSEPVNVPSGYKTTVGDRFFIIELFGDPGTFSADLTLTYGSGVITSNEEASPDSVILYKQDSNETSSWLAFGGATSATSATGVVTWTGITSFSQFVAVGPDDALPPPSYWDKDDAITAFKKMNYADWTDSDNQDCITDLVCLTRADSRGLFNIVTETEYDRDSRTSPAGTEWAVGTIDDLESLTFYSWYEALADYYDTSEPMGDLVGTDMVLHLIEENIYIDIKFTSWTDNGDGGGYGYIRGKGPNEDFNSPYDSEAGFAVNFDGGDNYYYSEAYYESLPDTFTIELWTKPNSVGDQMVIFTHDYEYMWMGINGSGNFFGLLYDETLGDTVRITGTTTATAGDWYHVALTGETDGDMKLYVNGREEASTSIGQVETNTGTYWLGTDYGESYYYDGSIDEVRIWNAARTPSQIRGNMYTPISGLPAELLVYWQFNEGEGDYTADYYNGYQAAVEYDYGEWVTSAAPFGSGSITTISAFQNGTTSSGNAALNMSDGFDNPVDVQVSELSAAPNSFPSGYNSNMGGKYFIIDLFGDPGTFSANLTLTFGSGVVTSAQEADPSTVKLYKRESNSSGSWTEFGGATTAIASSGEVTWSGITSFSQFIAVGEDNETPPPTIWSFDSDTLTFTKADYADYTDSANQDCLTENVCITRADNQGLFNIVQEEGYQGGGGSGVSPLGTLWAAGSTDDDVESLTYMSWGEVIVEVGGGPPYPGFLNQNLVMYLEDDNIYVDVIITDWTPSDNGGGFTYKRGTAAPAVLDIQIEDDTDVITYIDSAYTFDSAFFDLSDNFADSALTLTIDASLDGALFIDNNDNGDYDDGTDDLILQNSGVSYTPSGSSKLRYITDAGVYESVTIKLESSTSADSVLLNFYGVEGDPSISGNADEHSWHLMSNPFSTNVGTLFADVWTQGAVNSNAPQGNATLYTFSQDSSVYVPITTDLDTTSLSAGTGVLAYIFAFDDYAEGVPSGGGWPKTITNYGNPFGTDVDIPVKNVDHDGESGTTGYEGFALFGNPFGWELSADSVIATLQRVDATANSYVYRWDAVNGQFDQITSGAINPYESVFVRVEASGTSGTMNLDYSDRYQETPAKRLRESKLEMLLTHKGSGLKTDSYVTFTEKGKEGIDPRDAYYLGSYADNYANLYTRVGDQSLVINNIPAASKDVMEYPVYLDATVTGDFEIQWNPNLLPENGTFFLEDLRTGTRIDLRAQDSFTFTKGAKTKAAVDEENDAEAENGKKDEDLEMKDELMDKTAARTLDIDTEKNGQSTEKSVKRKTGLLLPSKSKSVATSKIDEQVFKLIINTGVVNDIEEDMGLPAVVELYQNYPNPFNPTSIIRYGVPEMSEVTLEVFDMLGRKVATLIDGESKQPGRYNVQFSARDMASGMYIYRLKIGSKVLTKKMTLIK